MLTERHESALKLPLFHLMFRFTNKLAPAPSNGSFISYDAATGIFE
jgi:hypothetical protein